MASEELAEALEGLVEASKEELAEAWLGEEVRTDVQMYRRTNRNNFSCMSDCEGHQPLTIFGLGICIFTQLSISAGP